MKKEAPFVVPFFASIKAKEPNTMKQRFGHAEDSGSPHNVRDYIIYPKHEVGCVPKEKLKVVQECWLPEK